ncbi:hypothetical protein FKV68_24030 (plasmid) [Sinorhizobium mexicanum]|uniref:Uncharacterized protein n=1 Tax=Sinorhizobium mexicanum TaxID=375549 RepID=A0A859QEQ4_9HYPH|nr:hypothetical protein FKV68_24030 [Sinorhizobium mexicanum]
MTSDFSAHPVLSRAMQGGEMLQADEVVGEDRPRPAATGRPRRLSNAKQSAIDERNRPNIVIALAGFTR